MTDKRSASDLSDPPEQSSIARNPPAQTGGLPAGQAGGSADMQALIGRQLRAVYDDIAKQPVPDRFLELMKQLDGGTAG